jgi:hypothetical protein
MKTKICESVTRASPFARTAEEEALVRNFCERFEADRAHRVRIPRADGAALYSTYYRDEGVGYARLAEALGTSNTDFIEGLISQLAEGGSKGKVDECEVNFMLAVIKGIKPKDQLEAMLAAQMAAVQITTMKIMQQFPQVKNLEQQDSAQSAFNKLMRTFTMQMEALRRYRTGGEQKVTVQYVSVADGGQAIVGPVTQAAPHAAPPKTEDKPKTLVHSQQAAMPIIEKPTRRPMAARTGAKK